MSPLLLSPLQVAMAIGTCGWVHDVILTVLPSSSFPPFFHLFFFVSFSQFKCTSDVFITTGLFILLGFGKVIKLGIGKIGPSSVTIHCAALESHLISVDLRVSLDL